MKYCSQCEEWVEPDGNRCPYCDKRLGSKEQMLDDMDLDEEIALEDEPVIFGKEGRDHALSEDEGEKPIKRKK